MTTGTSKLGGEPPYSGDRLGTDSVPEGARLRFLRELRTAQEETRTAAEGEPSLAGRGASGYRYSAAEPDDLAEALLRCGGASPAHLKMLLIDGRDDPVVLDRGVHQHRGGDGEADPEGRAVSAATLSLSS
ncbi:hypothetical protein, partial [Streptomyces canarius]